MKKLDRKKIKITKIITISVVIFITVILLMFNSGVAFLETLSGYIVYPVVNAVDSACTGIGNFFSGFGARTKLKEDLRIANEKIAQLETVQSVADEVKAENERLLALFNESEKYPSFEYEYVVNIIVKTTVSCYWKHYHVWIYIYPSHKGTKLTSYTQFNL